jgi:Trk-type K+ transport system membrane component
MQNLMIGFGVLMTFTLILGAIGFLVWFKFLRGKSRSGGWQPVMEIDTSFATFQADNFVGDDEM